ncbi:hypothetical protein BYT27DRAFT_7195569 [Phlegmacium glaucopus]|nr:hypothetical protein BYT27DRAFT_7195569 [Phlegmacium glaucopus]
MELHWQTHIFMLNMFVTGGAQMLSATLFELLLRWAWMHHLCRVIEFSPISVCLLRPQLVDTKLTVSQVIFPKTLLHYDIMVFITQSMDLQRCPLLSL